MPLPLRRVIGSKPSRSPSHETVRPPAATMHVRACHPDQFARCRRRFMSGRIHTPVGGIPETNIPSTWSARSAHVCHLFDKRCSLGPTKEPITPRDLQRCGKAEAFATGMTIIATNPPTLSNERLGFKYRVGGRNAPSEGRTKAIDGRRACHTCVELFSALCNVRRSTGSRILDTGAQTFSGPTPKFTLQRGDETER